MIAIRKSSIRNDSSDLRSYLIEEGVMLVRFEIEPFYFIDSNDHAH